MDVRAVCVGINAYPSAPLDNCVRDVERGTYRLMKCLGWPVRGVRSACGDSRAADLREKHAWAVQGDFWLLEHSGHGAQGPDRDGDEIDGLDELFCPIDFSWSDRNTWLTDDYYSALFATAKPGSQGVVIFDSCHSGTMHRSVPPGVQADKGGKVRTMPVPDEVQRRIRWTRAEARPLRTRRVIEGAPAGVTVISACRADQVAMDGSPVGDPRQGAFHGAWFAAWDRLPNGTLTEWVAEVNRLLGDAGYAQVAQIVTGEGGPERLPVMG